MQQIKKLLEVAETVQQHGNSKLAGWFSQKITKYLTSPEYQSLDQVFGLNSERGVPTQRTQHMKCLRNSILRKAYEYTDSNKKPTVRCDELAREIRDFERRIYPNWKTQGGPPENASELRKLLYQAKETGQPLSTSWRALYRQIFDT